MGLLSLVSQRRMQHKLHSLAGRVAAASLQTVVARLRQDVSSMTAAEAFGYVQARANLVVRSEVVGLAEAARLSGRHRDQLLTISLDIVTRHAIDQAKRSAAKPRVYRMAA